jgi:hypothetical protein
MDFIGWLQENGWIVETTQEDDGSGYYVIEITPTFDDSVGTLTLTVNT